jgi:plasmid stability protein
MLEEASDAVTEALSRWSKVSLSADRRTITVEASREEVPEVVAAAVKAGGRVLEFRPAQVKAEDLYAEVFRSEVTT